MPAAMHWPESAGQDTSRTRQGKAGQGRARERRQGGQSKIWAGQSKILQAGAGKSRQGRAGLVTGTDLLREGLVDSSSLLRELLHAIDVILLLQDRLWRCFSDREVVQVAAVPLVKEELVSSSGNDNVPGVDRARGTHEAGQENISHEDCCLVFTG